MGDFHLHADSDLDFTRLHIADPAIRQAADSGQSEQAERIALQRAVEALCDLAAARLACGKVDQAVKQMEQVLSFDPLNQRAFHNYTAVLLAHGLLRGANLEKLQRHLAQHWHTQPWMQQYRRILYAPRFLNLEFVSGKCNLRCRMCVGGHDKTQPGRLEYMTCEDFDKMLAAVPTVAGLTLSSGNSEPLLHPELEQIVDLASRHHVVIDFFTNGHPLNARKARKIVQSGTVGMINFSLDAATPETYRRLRGEDFHRVIQKIEMLQSMKKEINAARPMLSLSFVAMADNIAELPAFVEMAARLGAARIYVEDLIGWDSPDGVNLPATDHPEWTEFVQRGSVLAARHGIRFDVPQRLRPQPAAESACAASAAAPAADGPKLAHCGWMHGIWVQQDGRFDPCCLVHGVADLGNVKDGPILKNEKYWLMKEALAEGRVFAECVDQRACQYVQQQKAAGVPFRMIAIGSSRDSTPLEPGRPDEAAAVQGEQAASVLLAFAGVSRDE